MAAGLTSDLAGYAAMHARRIAPATCGAVASLLLFPFVRIRVRTSSTRHAAGTRHEARATSEARSARYAHSSHHVLIPARLVFSAASTQRTITTNTTMPVSSSIYRYLGVAVLASFVQYFMRTQQLYGPVGMCSQSDDDRSDWIEVDGANASNNSSSKINLLSGKIRARPCEAFSESYFEARAKFRFATRRLAELMPTVKLHTLSVMPGQDYTIDIAVIPGSGSETMGLTIHSSGCHGVEGEFTTTYCLAFDRKLLS